MNRVGRIKSEHQAARWYSCSNPPRRSIRCTRVGLWSVRSSCRLLKMSSQFRHSSRTVRTQRSAWGVSVGSLNRRLDHPDALGPDTPRSDLDKEQALDPRQRSRLDGEEVTRDHAMSLLADEPPPGGGRFAAGQVQDCEPCCAPRSPRPIPEALQARRRHSRSRHLAGGRLRLCRSSHPPPPPAVWLGLRFSTEPQSWVDRMILGRFARCPPAQRSVASPSCSRCFVSR